MDSLRPGADAVETVRDTGEAISPDLSESKTAEEYRRELHDVDERLGELYRERRAIMEAFSDSYLPVLPPPRQRTEHQQRVARCPRCGGRLDDDR